MALFTLRTNHIFSQGSFLNHSFLNSLLIIFSAAFIPTFMPVFETEGEAFRFLSRKRDCIFSSVSSGSHWNLVVIFISLMT